MHGNLVSPRGWLVALMILASLLAACAHNVPQDSKSGEDSKQKGAKPLVLENGEGRAQGIVTYPGGDRVDWKLVELPAKQRGTLELRLAWTPPRPGLQLAFDVFDEWGTPVVQSTRTGKRSAGRIRTAAVEGARGKYLVRIYAVNRGDAGKYRLTAEFKENSGLGFDPLKLEIPDPPRLADLPPVEVPCDEFAFDPKNPACRAVCPAAGAPPGWPACKDRCPTPPDINIPACLATMECPNPPDRRVRKCTPAKFGKCLDPANPDPNNPNCDNVKVAPVIGRIIGNQVSGTDVIITIGAGTNSGVKKDWGAVVLRGDSDQPLAGGDVTVIRVDKAVTVGRVRLTTDQLTANSRVKLSAP